MSIRNFLVMVLSSILVLITFTAAIHGYNTSMQQATMLADNNLKQMASTLAELDDIYTSSPHKNNTNSQLIFQIWRNDTLVLRSKTTPITPISHFISGFSENNFSQQRWRIYASKHHNKDQSVLWVFTAIPVNTLYTMAEKLILSAMTPIILSIPFIALLIWLIVWYALQPFNHLTKLLNTKKANDLSAIHLPNLPYELILIEQTINQLFSRLSHAFMREKHFASDAAHELRTPLSVLKLNADNLVDEIPQNETAAHLAKSVDRMAHVIDQILILNRTTAEQFKQQLNQLNVRNVAQETIAELYPQIAHRQQNIELIAEDVSLLSSEFALLTLFQNLISNASKYSPEKGNILVSLSCVESHVIISVEDSGQGISPQEQYKVFHRFYRIGGDQNPSNVVGCGLGLAIVKDIVKLHHGSISLERSKTYGGLAVEIKLPQVMGLKDIHETSH